MIIAIQQPEHIPWLGFFDKMTKCDKFVLLDNVQFKKRYFENRNKIRTRDDYKWVTVSVVSKARYTQVINEVEVDNYTRWKRKYWLSIVHAYSKAPYFKRYSEKFEDILKQEWIKLVDLNVALLKVIRNILGITTEMIMASCIVSENKKGSDLILSICEELKASKYISGPDGINYLSVEEFKNSGIHIEYHRYQHPEYKQMYTPFLSHMSVVDLIFNHGEQSLNILKN